MLQPNVLVQERPTVGPWVYVDHERAEILRVLERAAEDQQFIARLTSIGANALRGYELTPEAQAALLGGDIRWVEERVGKLTARQCTWLDCRLQQEIW